MLTHTEALRARLLHRDAPQPRAFAEGRLAELHLEALERLARRHE
ncbi:hypothetical protein [Streptomyces sp. NPDC002994]